MGRKLASPLRLSPYQRSINSQIFVTIAAQQPIATRVGGPQCNLQRLLPQRLPVGPAPANAPPRPAGQGGEKQAPAILQSIVIAGLSG
jgi:hypothetical protein